MNKHLSHADLSGPLTAVPAPGNTATYFRLHAMRDAAHALEKAIERYLHTPALPECATYREARMALVEEEAADMRKVLGNG